MSLVDEIQRLDDLRRDDVLTEEEFARAKEKLLRQDGQSGLGKSIQGSFEEPDERTWGLFIHLSQFLGYAIPVLGWIVPIVIWQVMKDKSEIMDAHGINITNWLISEFIYLVAFALLSTVIIGIPFLIAAMIAGIVFPILGALKAQNLEVWGYPLTIRFIQPRLYR